MTKNAALRLSAVALLAIPFGTARADLVLTSLELQSGQSFGSVSTIFTLQVTGGNQTLGTQIEQGCNAWNNVTGAYSAADNNPADPTINLGNLCAEASANQVASSFALPSFGGLGITSANQVGLLLSLDQISNSGITLADMNLSFYTASGDVIFNATLPNGWCTVGALCSGADTFLSSINSQGGNARLFVLDAAQQAALAAAIAGAGASFSSILVGAGGNFGCAGTQTANCKEANGGAEIFQLANIASPLVSTVPEPSTALLMATGLLGMVGVVRRRRRQAR